MNKVFVPSLALLLTDFFDPLIYEEDSNCTRLRMDLFETRYNEISLREEIFNHELEERNKAISEKYHRKNAESLDREYRKLKETVRDNKGKEKEVQRLVNEFCRKHEISQIKDFERELSGYFDIREDVRKERDNIKRKIMKDLFINHALGFCQREALLELYRDKGIPLNTTCLITGRKSGDYVEDGAAIMKNVGYNDPVFKEAYDFSAGVIKRKNTIGENLPDVKETCESLKYSIFIKDSPLKKWGDGINKTMTGRSAFLIVVYLIYRCKLEAAEIKEKMYGKCLEYLLYDDTGIYDSLLSFDNEANEKLFVQGLFILLSRAGKKADGYSAAIKAFNEDYTEIINNTEGETERYLNDVEAVLYEAAQWYQPRGIKNEKMRHSEMYVWPLFAEGRDPVKELKEAKASTRLVIVGKSGIGKSMYTGALIQSWCRERMDYVIYVDAEMFSTAFKEAGRKTDPDLVSVFLKHYGQAKGNHEYDENIKKKLMEQAEIGRLLLIFDAYDELSSVEETGSFARSLRKFVNTFCVSNNESHGANVIVTTRKRADRVMAHLKSALGIDNNNAAIIEMKDFDIEQQLELVKKWRAKLDFDERKLIDRIRNNRFYKELAATPAFLALICNTTRNELKSVIRLYIDNLVEKARSLYRSDNTTAEIVQEGYLDINDILEHSAYETIRENRQSITVNKLSRVLGETVNRYFNETLEDDPESITGKLIEVITTETGLLISSEDREHEFEFINSMIENFLAAEYIRKSGDPVEKLDELNINGVCRTIVPLICSYDKASELRTVLEIVDHRLIDRYEEDEKALRSVVNDIYNNEYGVSLLTATRSGKYAGTTGAEINEKLKKRNLIK